MVGQDIYLWQLGRAESTRIIRYLVKRLPCECFVLTELFDTGWVHVWQDAWPVVIMFKVNDVTQ